MRPLDLGDIQAENRIKKPGGRYKRYDDPAILGALKYILEKLRLQSSKKLKVALPATPVMISPCDFTVRRRIPAYSSVSIPFVSTLSG